MKYRKIPVVIEASPWWKPGDHPAVMHPVPAEVPVGTEADRGRLGAIKTLEGWLLVTPGDFVIRGVHGEHDACKAEICAKTYEAAE